MLSYKLNVSYHNDEFDCPIVSLELNYNSVKIHWNFSDANFDRKTWMDIKTAMWNEKDSKGFNISVGDESYWKCKCKDGIFELTYAVSGMDSGNSNIIIEIPCEEMKWCISEIVNVLESASRNEKYE